MARSTYPASYGSSADEQKLIKLHQPKQLLCAKIASFYATLCFGKLILYQKWCCLQYWRSLRNEFFKPCGYGDKLSKFDTLVRGGKGSENSYHKTSL